MTENKQIFQATCIESWINSSISDRKPNDISCNVLKSWNVNSNFADSFNNVHDSNKLLFDDSLALEGQLLKVLRTAEMFDWWRSIQKNKKNLINFLKKVFFFPLFKKSFKKF